MDVSVSVCVCVAQKKEINCCGGDLRLSDYEQGEDASFLHPSYLAVRSTQIFTSSHLRLFKFLDLAEFFFLTYQQILKGLVHSKLKFHSCSTHRCIAGGSGDRDSSGVSQIGGIPPSG